MRRLLLIFLLVAPAAHADFGEYQSHEVRDRTIIVTTDRGSLRISAIDDAALEVHYEETGHEQLPSFALAGSQPTEREVFQEYDDKLVFSTGELTAIVNKSPVSIRYLYREKELAAENDGYFSEQDKIGFRFELDEGEKIMGGGERVLGMDRRGHRVPLYNRAHYAYETESKQMYYSVPAVVSSDRYMIVFDNSASGWLDIGATDADTLAFEAVGGRTAYIIVAGDSFPELVRNYTDVTGRQPLPPRWAFGNFASRFGYRTEKEARDVVRRFRRQKIPLDTIVIDIYWFGPDIQDHMGKLDWDRDAWPTAEDMVSDFAGDGVKTIVVTEPFILSSSDRWQSAVDNKALAKTKTGEPRRFDFYFGNTGLVDIFDEKARDWFWEPYKMLFDQGMAGSWGDLGEPEVHPDDALHWLSGEGVEARGDEVHNAYGHEWTRMVYENQVRDYPDMRPMIMMRSGFAGTQRYGIIPWTGDVQRSWGGLKPQVELSLTMGLLGLGYTHSDLGGFTRGTPEDTMKFNRELYLRWMQYGVFQPVYRPHAQDGLAAEPVFHDRRTRRIARDYIKLRYRLLPYHYTLAYENSVTGMPLMRPLFFENEDDIGLIDVKDTYLWGDAFLVKPVTDPGVDAVDVTLPDGAWFDFWTDERHEGGSTATIPVDLETIPVLVRAGSFVPMIDDIQTTADYSSEKLTLHYYADESVCSATGQMYEDDGKSRLSLPQGKFELLKFHALQDGDSLTIGLRREGGTYTGRPETREVDLVIHNWTAPVDRASFGGEPLRISHNRKTKTLTATVNWDHSEATLELNGQEPNGKPVVYQAFTRLFGNTNSTNKPWGTIEENGVGKFADFTTRALEGIRELGTTHIWYMGVPHHAVIRDYTAYGISNDDPDVVKGRAGSPYAVKDYYNVNPDLATDPARRLEEFEALIKRTHDAGMKVVIDIVPNHVARGYQSISRPEGVEDFGANDDTSVAWARDNNFYYVVGEDFRVPEFPEGYRPLGGEAHPLADGKFEESPAKWTGNGARSAQPKHDDWYETVKINHGVRPDGSHAFDSLPEEARRWSTAEHAAFWRSKDVPDSWKKFEQIVHYWLDKGVDGFRFDMSEMVPVEFWSYLNSSIKAKNPDAMLISEIYNPAIYRDYVELGRMDYLYDKVGMYDTLRDVVQGKTSAASIDNIHSEVLDIEEHMLHFLENHDEPRIASPAFAGDAAAGKPAMVVSSLIGSSPTLVYIGQDVGEDARGNPAFNEPMRNSLFDYQGMPAHQRWMNDGAFDGGRLTDDEKALRDFYVRLLNLSASHPALMGDYAALPTGNDRVFAFARWQGDERLIVVSNFDGTSTQELALEVPGNLIDEWQLGDGRYTLDEQLYGENNAQLLVDGGKGRVDVTLAAFSSAMLSVSEQHIVRHENFGSDHVIPRNVDVWLPRGYHDSNKDYKVIYFHDGQNLYNPEWVYYTQTDWGVDETLQRLIDEGEVDDTIVVGIWSTPRRIAEYLPSDLFDVASPDYRSVISNYLDGDVESDEYLQFLVEDLKPFIDSNYRTRPGRSDTFLMGSSMGGIISLYGVMRYPEVFGGAACVSTHWPSTMTPDDPEANAGVIGLLRTTIPAQGSHKLYFDFGTEELDSQYEPHQDAVDTVMRELGYEQGPLWQTRKFEGANHSEGAWRERLHIPLKFLLGADDNKE